MDQADPRLEALCHELEWLINTRELPSPAAAQALRMAIQNVGHVCPNRATSDYQHDYDELRAMTLWLESLPLHDCGPLPRAAQDACALVLDAHPNYLMERATAYWQVWYRHDPAAPYGTMESVGVITPIRYYDPSYRLWEGVFTPIRIKQTTGAIEAALGHILACDATYRHHAAAINEE